ncbi:MAG: DbpA RNA binding domain-containing protein [Gemmatimonadaceae bacterium]|nr:DbpA RNA binding domain-containing protein [Gemmatimonadaceae bacterium]
MEERERPAVARNQNVLHVLPHDAAAISQFIEPALERLDPENAETQLLILTPDSETAVLIAEAATRARTGTPARVLPVTAWRRAARLQRLRPATVVAGTPSDILELIRASAIKLDTVTTLVLAWADVMNDAAGEPLEAVMAEVPKEAARVIVASHMTPAVEALAERYARRARRSQPVAVVEEIAVDLRYVAIAAQARESAFRRLLDDTDPERAAVFVRSDEAAKEVADVLRALGISDEEPSIVITRGEPVENVALIVLYEQPMSAEALQTLADGGTAVIALATARQIPALRVLAGGGRVTPFVLSGPGARARSRDEKVRDELRAALANGVNARELLALEPLLAEFDGVEIAAAALRMLERERESLKPAEKAPKTDHILPPSVERAAPTERAERADREERPRSDRGERSDRGDRGERAPRGERPDRDRGARPERGSRDSAPRSGGFSRGAPSRTPESRGAMSRLFVNAGKADGMTPRDLVGSIANESGISSDQIGKIELRDTHSIVEISTPVAEAVANKMNGITVRGKRLTMRVDNDAPSSRSARGDRPERSDRGDRGERSSSPRFERSGSSDRGSRPERSGSSDRGTRSYAPRSDRGAPSSRGERPSSGPRRDAPRRDGPPRSRRPS